MVNFSSVDCWDHPSFVRFCHGGGGILFCWDCCFRTTVGMGCWGGIYAYAQFRRVRSSFLASCSGNHGRSIPCGAGTGSGSPGIRDRTGPGGFCQCLPYSLGLSLCYALPLGFTIAFGFGFSIFVRCTRAANRPLLAGDAQSAGWRGAPCKQGAGQPYRDLLFRGRHSGDAVRADRSRWKAGHPSA